jgi:hypothetical protein
MNEDVKGFARVQSISDVVNNGTSFDLVDFVDLEVLYNTCSDRCCLHSLVSVGRCFQCSRLSPCEVV